MYLQMAHFFAFLYRNQQKMQFFWKYNFFCDTWIPLFCIITKETQVNQPEKKNAGGLRNLD